MFKMTPDAKKKDIIFEQKKDILLLTNIYGKSLITDYGFLDELKLAYGQKHSRGKILDFTGTLAKGYEKYPLTLREFELISKEPIYSDKVLVYMGRVGLLSGKKYIMPSVIIPYNTGHDEQAYMLANRISIHVPRNLDELERTMVIHNKEKKKYEVINLFPMDRILGIYSRSTYSWFGIIRKLYKNFS